MAVLRVLLVLNAPAGERGWLERPLDSRVGGIGAGIAVWALSCALVEAVFAS